MGIYEIPPFDCGMPQFSDSLFEKSLSDDSVSLLCLIKLVTVM